MLWRFGSIRHSLVYLEKHLDAPKCGIPKRKVGPQNLGNSSVGCEYKSCRRESSILAGTFKQQSNYEMSAFGGPGGRQINTKPTP